MDGVLFRGVHQSYVLSLHNGLTGLRTASTLTVAVTQAAVHVQGRFALVYQLLLNVSRLAGCAVQI